MEQLIDGMTIRRSQIASEDGRLKRMAKGLRKEATPAEAKAWALLRGRRLGGRKFRRQHVLCGYIVDFFCREERLCIELDGSHHSAKPEHLERDQKRDQLLAANGYSVQRYSNEMILNFPEDFLNTILSSLIP